MAPPPSCFSFNKCAYCSLNCETSVNFMQHCVNVHLFEVPELRALYNVRPLYFYGKKGLVSKFLDECANKAIIRTDLILSILYDDPAPVSCPYTAEDERVYLKALSLAKYFRAEIKKAASSEDTQLLRNATTEREAHHGLSDTKESKCDAATSRAAFMTPRELEELTDLRNSCSCKPEIKFLSNRLVSIEEKSVDLMLTLRSYLDATNKPLSSKTLTANSTNTPESTISPLTDLNATKGFHEFDRGEASELHEAWADDSGTNERNMRMSVEQEMDYDEDLSSSSATNISDISADGLPTEEGSSIDSVLLARLLISNWLTQGQPRVRENQIYHPLEDRLLKNDELCKAVARMILLNPEMVIDPNDFKAQLNTKWFQFVNFNTKAKVFKKLVKDGLLLKCKDVYVKIKKKSRFRKNLEYQLKLAEYGLRMVDYYQTDYSF